MRLEAKPLAGRMLAGEGLADGWREARRGKSK
jgi:hypothetical protein